MSGFLIFILISHIFLGTLSIVFLTAYSLSLFKKDVNFNYLKRMSFFAFLATIASWITGGFYYVTYYGKSVKPIILKGDFAWVHKIIMETKEHIFLFLPFLTITLFAITLFNKEEIEKNMLFKFSICALCFLTMSVALAVMLGGYIVSGAVGK